MNNLNSNTNFESSPIASPMAPNLNASMPMMGGRRKRNRKMHKKGGMYPDTPEKDKQSQVTPVDENNQMVKPKKLFGNDHEDIMDVTNDEVAIDIANDEDYNDLENIPDESKMDEDRDRKIDILDKLESGVDIESRGGSRRRKRRIRRNKTKKLSKKTKKSKRRGSNKKTRKMRRSGKK